MEKRLAAVWLVIVLLMTAAAGCETASGFMETEEGSIYPNTTLLTEASFPQVSLSPHKAFTLFQNSRKEPRYVTFPCPEGARCYRFETDCCYLLIPEEDLPFIFERFYKVDKSHAQSSLKGTGLGLAIAKEIVRMHGAQIEVFSQMGMGTRFVITFPAETVVCEERRS